MNFIDQIKERAKQDIKTIVLPESQDVRVLKAAAMIRDEGIANVILVGKKENVLSTAGDINLDGVQIVDINNYEKFETYVEAFYEMRKSKGITPDQAREL
jgi:phosphate acetyltransferase